MAVAGVPMEDFNSSTNIMVYGNNGVGKTVLGGTAPSALFWACEPGVKAAKRQGSKALARPIGNWDDAWKLLLELEDDPSGYEWCIVDTLSTLENKAMRQILDDMHADNPKRDPDLPGLQEHQLRQNRLKRLVERLVDLPINVLFLCHEMAIENESGDTVYLPSISGGADKGYPTAHYVMGLMDCVGYMGLSETPEGNQVRRILWQSWYNKKKDCYYTAKDQFDALGMYTDDVTMPDIIKMIGAPPRTAESSTAEEPPKQRRRRAAQRG